MHDARVNALLFPRLGPDGHKTASNQRDGMEKIKE